MMAVHEVRMFMVEEVRKDVDEDADLEGTDGEEDEDEDGEGGEGGSSDGSGSDDWEGDSGTGGSVFSSGTEATGSMLGSVNSEGERVIKYDVPQRMFPGTMLVPQAKASLLSGTEEEGRVGARAGGGGSRGGSGGGSGSGSGGDGGERGDGEGDTADDDNTFDDDGDTRVRGSDGGGGDTQREEEDGWAHSGSHPGRGSSFSAQSTDAFEHKLDLDDDDHGGDAAAFTDDDTGINTAHGNGTDNSAPGTVAAAEREASVEMTNTEGVASSFELDFHRPFGTVRLKRAQTSRGYELPVLT